MKRIKVIGVGGGIHYFNPSDYPSKNLYMHIADSRVLFIRDGVDITGPIIHMFNSETWREVIVEKI